VPQLCRVVYALSHEQRGASISTDALTSWFPLVQGSWVDIWFILVPGTVLVLGSEPGEEPQGLFGPP